MSNRTSSTALGAASVAWLEQFEGEQPAPEQGAQADQWRGFISGLDGAAEPGHLARPAQISSAQLSELVAKQSKVHQLVSAIRYRGHREADLDPLGLLERPPVHDLHPAHYGFDDADMASLFNTGSVFMQEEASLRELYKLMQDTYCRTIGTELTHVSSQEQKRWVQEKLETQRGRPNITREKKLNILERVTAAQKLEDYLHRKYVGQKRFSLEGGESMIAGLDEVICRAAGSGVREVVIGMAHRGRLNVLVNILGKHPRNLFGEFEGKIDLGSGSGDVKYHLGFSSNVQTPRGDVHLVLAFNPSHLEIINPVVEGSVRARQERRGDLERSQVLPVLIHGDAAFAGQGVVTETLNLSETRGYGTGGTVHFIVNNQIGFTTSDPRDARSTQYCTDVAKLVQAPIFHVNGNDPEAVVFVSRLALEFRMRFKKDVVVDIVCYRRWGHNEADEPMVTQPMMYKRIREQREPSRLYAEQLVEEGVLEPGEGDRIAEQYVEALENNEVMSRPMLEGQEIESLANWEPYLDNNWRLEADTTVSSERIEALGSKLTQLPDDFEVHRAVHRVLDARAEMARGERDIDWGMAETLAYGTLLEDGYAIRISGQDSQRGTFFHRHAVVHNQRERGTYTPLNHLFEGQPRFRVINSLLSEEAVLGFEYGYTTAEPECLTIWEAQFGDFVNGAQVVIDQFLSSSEAKWGRYSGLAMFLPHGYDGAGPEHSSARLERFLQLCAEENMQVCVPSTPAQAFHMIRRQMIRPVRTPLIVMTPKSLLRHRLAVNTRDELGTGGFEVLLDETDGLDPKKVTRLVLCTGKVYYDLLEKRREEGIEDVAIVRVEQLYPFPEKEIKAILAKYSKANDVVWAQEEPRNQGSWFFMLSRRHLAGCIGKRHTLHYAGREYSASPAVGYLNVHLEEQRALVASALGLDALHLAGRKSA